MIIYDTLYELLNTYIYGLPTELTAYQDLVLTNLATIGSVFVCALPILTIYWSFRMISTLGNRW